MPPFDRYHRAKIGRLAAEFVRTGRRGWRGGRQAPTATAATVAATQRLVSAVNAAVARGFEAGSAAAIVAEAVEQLPPALRDALTKRLAQDWVSS